MSTESSVARDQFESGRDLVHLESPHEARLATGGSLGAVEHSTVEAVQGVFGSSAFDELKDSISQAKLCVRFKDSFLNALAIDQGSIGGA